MRNGDPPAALPLKGAHFSNISGADSAVTGDRGSVRGHGGGCAGAVPGIRAAVRPFPGEWVGVRGAGLCTAEPSRGGGWLAAVRVARLLG